MATAAAAGLVLRKVLFACTPQNGQILSPFDARHPAGPKLTPRDGVKEVVIGCTGRASSGLAALQVKLKWKAGPPSSASVHNPAAILDQFADPSPRHLVCYEDANGNTCVAGLTSMPASLLALFADPSNPGLALPNEAQAMAALRQAAQEAAPLLCQLSSVAAGAATPLHVEKPQQTQQQQQQPGWTKQLYASFERGGGGGGGGGNSGRGKGDDNTTSPAQDPPAAKRTRRMRTRLALPKTVAEAAATFGEALQQENLESGAAVAGLSANGAVLKPHQVYGANFLLLADVSGVGGTLLADEMGLGKTAQAVTFLAAAKAADDDRGPFLTIVPPTLFKHWKREFERWGPSLKVGYYSADDPCIKRIVGRRMLLWANKHGGGIGGGGGGGGNGNSGGGGSNGSSNGSTNYEPFVYDAVLCTDGAFAFEDSSKQLAGLPWDIVVVDEAHRFRSAAATRTRVVNQLAKVARTRVLITGTPFSNNVAELRTLLGLMNPSLFDGKALLVDGGCRTADDRQLAMASSSAAAAAASSSSSAEGLYAQLREYVQPFTLRRLKGPEQGLPILKETLLVVPLTREQEEVYDACVRLVPGTPSWTGRQPTVDTRPKTPASASAVNRQAPAALVIKLRRASLHGMFVRHAYGDDTVDAMARAAINGGVVAGPFTEVVARLRQKNDLSLHVLGRSYPCLSSFALPSDAVVAGSGKVVHLRDSLLPHLASKGHRPLIFSSSPLMLTVIGRVLDDMGLSFKLIDGGVKPTDRQDAADAFNDLDSTDFAVLLTTACGGEGLTLTGADTVVLLDTAWNPQTDAQAIARVHRIGQTKPVHVYRLVSANTVDEYVVRTAASKMAHHVGIFDAPPPADDDDDKGDDGKDAAGEEASEEQETATAWEAGDDEDRAAAAAAEDPVVIAVVGAL